ncbi:hypothetical protein KEM56_002482 [Ascosphaera pollenicola]|nr:hypothetical protein KEM56_002482 [Ascosphaera pollenicola]
MVIAMSKFAIVALLARISPERRMKTVDFLFGSFVVIAVLARVAMNLDIITTCIPGLYRVLSTMTSGLIGLQDHTQRIELSYIRSGSDPRKHGYLTGTPANHLIAGQPTHSSAIGISREITQVVERIDDNRTEECDVLNIGRCVTSRAECHRCDDEERLIDER